VAADPEPRPPAPVLAAISAGGVLGAVSRYGIGVAWPHDLRAFAWSTWTINVTGCLLIGVLMVLIAHHWPRRRLIRPFWGVGVLGGYTTFSTASVDVLRAAPATALLYLGMTLIGALLAVWAGTAATEAVLRR
jgi:fluoride exporter